MLGSSFIYQLTITSGGNTLNYLHATGRVLHWLQIYFRCTCVLTRIHPLMDIYLSSRYSVEFSCTNNLVGVFLGPLSLSPKCHVVNHSPFISLNHIVSLFIINHYLIAFNFFHIIFSSLLIFYPLLSQFVIISCDRSRLQ